MPKIIVLGEALIDIFAESGVPLHQAKSLHPSPGGAPANVAVALARLGTDVGFVGKVGVDDYGTFLIDLLTQEGVDTTHFIADPNGPTMLAIVASPSPTEQSFILYNGANALLSIAEIPESYITDADIFVFSSVTLASDSRDAALQAAQWARAAGKHVIFDINLRPLVWPDLAVARHWINQAVSLATIIKLNDTELDFLTNITDPAMGSQKLLQAHHLQLCCVSLGEKGAYSNNGATDAYVPAYAINVLDTTGSGDAFVAGLAYQLSQVDQHLSNLTDETLTQIVAFANACGALAATQVGAMSASPALASVRRFMEWG